MESPFQKINQSPGAKIRSAGSETWGRFPVDGCTNPIRDPANSILDPTKARFGQPGKTLDRLPGAA
jgi:hypothetical protein